MINPSNGQVIDVTDSFGSIPRIWLGKHQDDLITWSMLLYQVPQSMLRHPTLDASICLSHGVSGIPLSFRSVRILSLCHQPSLTLFLIC